MTATVTDAPLDLAANDAPMTTKGIDSLQHVLQPKATSAGPYTVRFAHTIEEIRAAQALRYRIFYQEKQGNSTAEMQAAERDMDEWDDGGFHVIVLDTRADKQPAVVGTLRLFDSECLAPQQHFYTEEAFDLGRIHKHIGLALLHI